MGLSLHRQNKMLQKEEKQTLCKDNFKLKLQI